MNKQNHKDLVQATEQFSDYVIQNYLGSFGDYVDAILGEIGVQPALFFLDPIGLKGLEWENLSPIFERGSKPPSEIVTELLIRYDAQTALRLAGFDKPKLVYSTTLQTFQNIYGVDDPEYWRSYIDKCDPEDKVCQKEAMTEAYQDRLRVFFKYVLRVPIKSREEKLQYFLIFATRNLKGVVAMNDALYKIQRLP